jgi:choline dehydrogenase-like flavoprotein
MGTARMGTDPATSVVDTHGQSHEVPGLYVADASVLPTALGANPMLTIMACARHIARGIAERLS